MELPDDLPADAASAPAPSPAPSRPPSPDTTGRTPSADAGPEAATARAEAGPPAPDAGGTARIADAMAAPDVVPQLPTGQGPFVEQNGVVVIEVESEPRSGAPPAGWSKKTEIADFTGTSYYEWTGADSSSGGKGTLVYEVQIKTPGNYEFRWRNRIAQGTSSTECNDSFVRFPTGQNVAGEFALSGWTKIYMNKVGAWTWTASTKDHDPQRIRQSFSAGVHRVEVSGRSRGHAIDRIALYRYDSMTFAETQLTALPLSPRQ